MFFGRESQLEQLEALWGKSVSSFVTCRGRRRVGKSTLIEEFARRSGARFIRIEGVRPGKGTTAADERAAFARQLAKQTGASRKTPEDWLAAFDALDGRISDDGRTVVLLDEISWLAHGDDTFADYLKIAWDGGLKKHGRLVLVACGSVSAWIRDNIVRNRAWVGRRSLDMVVPELPLRECAKFWGKAAGRIDVREIVDVLSVTGGVPRYLEEIDPRRSAEENIRQLAFRPNGVLRDDFDDMFGDVVTSKPKLAARVLRCLVDGPRSCAEVAKALGIGRGGDVSAAMSVLEEAGFAAPECTRNPETGEEHRERRYRLRDNYARFYLKYVEPQKAVIDEGSFSFSSLREFEGWDTVMGLAFENLVVNNVRELIPFLHLDGSLVMSAGPYRRPATNGKNGRKGCQVDLLVQTRRSLFFVEIKRRKEIGREAAAQVDDQVRAVSRPRGVSARTALVYEGHLSPVAAADGYFDAIVPFQKLLGLPAPAPAAP